MEPAVRIKAAELLATAYDYRGQIKRDVFDQAEVGCSRCVILDGRYAYKLAAIRDDYRYIGNNRKEWDLWRKMPTSVRALMAKPVYITGCGNILVMERVKGTLWSTYKDIRERKRKLDEFDGELLRRLKLAGFDSEYIEDITADNHFENIGVKEDGSTIWIDYAGLGDY